jgi:hypothetical protein
LRYLLAQISRGRTDKHLHRKQTTSDQPFLRRIAQAKSNIHTILNLVANAIIELNVRLHLGIKSAILI